MTVHIRTEHGDWWLPDEAIETLARIEFTKMEYHPWGSLFHRGDKQSAVALRREASRKLMTAGIGGRR